MSQTSGTSDATTQTDITGSHPATTLREVVAEWMSYRLELEQNEYRRRMEIEDRVTRILALADRRRELTRYDNSWEVLRPFQ